MKFCKLAFWHHDQRTASRLTDHEQLAFLIAQLTAVVANTSSDDEGKQYVYRGSNGEPMTAADFLNASDARKLLNPSRRFSTIWRIETNCQNVSEIPP